MRCQQCGYLLFNLTRSDCPECAEPFSVENYRFPPGSVTFHCPHCDQRYYGNDQDGLPQPRAFVCVQCGQSISLGRMRVAPQTDDAMGTLKGRSPWDRRKELGLFHAWSESFIMILLKPSAFFRLHKEPSLKESFIFSMICLYAGLSLMFTFQMVLVWIVGKVSSSAAGAGGGTGPPWMLMSWAYLCMALIYPLILPWIGAGLASCTIHIGLFFVAPRRKPFADTMRTVMYSYAPYTLCLIPVCGNWIAGIWQMVAMTAGVKVLHQIDGWRASVAVLWPIFLTLGIILSILVFLALGRLS